MTIETGGPAFPCIEPAMTGISSDGIERWENEAHGGMILRDYFAAKAITGIVSGGTQGDPIDSLAHIAYMIADAMLEARKS